MKINSLSIQGWRSFAYNEPVILENLKRINIIIGTNNSGKSNIFRYLFHVREEISRELKAKGVNLELKDYGAFNRVHSSFSTNDTWAWEGNDIMFKVTLEEVDEQYFTSLLPSLHNTKDVELKAHHKINEGLSCYSTLYESNLCLLEEFQGEKPKILNTENKEYINHLEDSKYLIDTIAYWKSFIDSLVFIDPVRHYSRNKSEFNESDFDGSDIVEEVIKLKNERDMEWRQYKKCIENWLELILLEFIQLDPTDTKLRFYINRGEQEISASLENLGTGVSQLVMLLSYLYLNREKSLNVFIEEPESNLHPEAVVQLVKIMEENFINHRFFITTHSSILLDQLNNNWSIHRVYRKGNEASKTHPCTEILAQYNLLDDLGIRPSKMLQSNLIIWIEGPSDRTYINKWIRDHSDLVEGKHYSFLMYGGANLSNYDLIDSDEYINLLKTSRYSIIVCDSDKKSDEGNLKGRVQRLLERIASISFDDGLSLDDYVQFWVTSGREIENYIPGELLEQVLFSQDFLRSYILLDQGKRGILKLKSEEVIFGKYDSFDEVYASKYIFEDSTSLNEKQLKSISSEFSRKKGNIARKVVENWTEQHYSPELLETIKRQIIHIQKANNLSRELVTK